MAKRIDYVNYCLRGVGASDKVLSKNIDLISGPILMVPRSSMDAINLLSHRKEELETCKVTSLNQLSP